MKKYVGWVWIDIKSDKYICQKDEVPKEYLSSGCYAPNPFLIDASSLPQVQILYYGSENCHEVRGWKQFLSSSEIRKEIYKEYKINTKTVKLKYDSPVDFNFTKDATDYDKLDEIMENVIKKKLTSILEIKKSGLFDVNLKYKILRELSILNSEKELEFWSLKYINTFKDEEPITETRISRTFNISLTLAGILKNKILEIEDEEFFLDLIKKQR